MTNASSTDSEKFDELLETDPSGPSVFPLSDQTDCKLIIFRCSGTPKFNVDAKRKLKAKRGTKAPEETCTSDDNEGSIAKKDISVKANTWEWEGTYLDQRDMWKCVGCYLINNSDADICPSCDAPKPETATAANMTTTSAKTSSTTVAASSIGVGGFYLPPSKDGTLGGPNPTCRHQSPVTASTHVENCGRPLL